MYRLSWKRKIYSVRAASLAVFVLSILFLVVLLFFDGRTQVEREQERALYAARHYATNLSSAIKNTTSMLYMLEALIVQGGGHIRAFDNISRDIIRFYPFVRTVALAPGGTIQAIYPLSGYLPVLGHDALSSHNQSFSLTLPKKDAVTLFGPFEMVTGGLGVVGRLPVFTGPKGNDFWGMVCISLDFHALIAHAELPQLQEQGYAYTLWRQDPESGERKILSSSTIHAKDEPLEYAITLPNTIWTLAVVPVAGWISSDWLLVHGFPGLLICLLLTFLAGTICDLFNKKRQLESLSATDALTQLPNRLSLSRYFEKALFYARLQERLLAVCFLDMNGFKSINDTFGHKAGDTLLVDFSRRVNPYLGKRDFFARLGGDEFVLLLDAESDLALQKRLDALLALLETPFSIAGQLRPIRLSIGVSRYPQDGDSMDRLLRRADVAMYCAKGQQSKRYCFFQEKECSQER